MRFNFKGTTITALMVSIFLSYVLFTTKDMLTRVIVIPFLLFGIGMFIKNICLMFNKTEIAKICSKIIVVSFFVYYFGFLIFWDYAAINNKDYMSFAFSVLAWLGGVFVAYRRYLKFKTK